MILKYNDNKGKIYTKDIKKVMFLDIETIGTINTLESCYPFEIGIKIIDIPTQTILKEKSYIVRKFFNNKYIMGSTFSATKIPTYKEKLATDKRYKLYSAREISDDIQKLISKYDIKYMVGHNCKFDYTMLEMYFNEFETTNPFENIDVIDTLEMAKFVTHSKAYEKYCLLNKDNVNKATKESNFITKTGRVRTTAQAIYSYITQNPDFKESHTGLEDIDIDFYLAAMLDIWLT